ncbi:hypothetical protein ACROYT_G039556 [Oculina patagonica]
MTPTEASKKKNEGTVYFNLYGDMEPLSAKPKFKANFPLSECQNGCCGSQPCLNGGTCHETCDVMGKRFTCSCKPNITGTFCESAICSTPDWLQFNGSCFKAFTEKVNWFEAQKTCRSLNSNLTSIHSAEENDFVRDKVTPLSEPVWIGLNNLKNNAVFEWDDGSDVSFTNWNPYEPNNLGGSENCTELRSRVNISSDYSSFCKFDNKNE